MNKQGRGGIEQRVWMHYKSLKNSSPLEWVCTKKCGWVNPCAGRFGYTPHGHGYYKTTTSNEVWLRLARTHKMKMREIKDIISKRRGKA